MKWLKKIFSREKASSAPSEPPPKLALSRVEEWLADRFAEPGFEDGARTLYASIERLARKLEGDLSALEAAEPGEDAPPRLLKAGTATRETVVRQMRVLVEKLAPPRRADQASAEEYHSAILKLLQNTVQKFGRAQRYTAALFPGEVEAIKSDMGSISRLLSDLSDLLQEREAGLGAYRGAASAASRVRERRGQIEALTAEISDGEALLALLRDQETGHQKEIEAWARSDEGMRMREEKRSLEEKMRERDQVEMSMRDLVAPLAKALNRAVKQDESDRIALQHREVFDLLSGSPTRALEGDVSGALFELRSKVDLLGLREKIRERVIEHIDHLQEDRPLQLLKARHAALTAEIELLEESLSKRGSETGRLRDERDQVRQKIPALEAGLEERRRSLALLEDRLSGDLSDLKARLEDIADGPIEVDPSL